MSLTFDNLIALHEMLFPQTNLHQQLAKYEEEQQEYKETRPNSEEGLYELADMVIVSAGIARFAYSLGLDYLCGAMTLLDKTEWSTESLWQAVEKKVRVNMRRDWTKKADVGYHHTEEGE